MRLVIVVGWALLVAEAAVITAMFVRRDAGDDAAGRGASRALSALPGVTLLAATLLFVWGQRGGPRAALWAGFAVMTLPLAAILRNAAARGLTRLDLATGHVRQRAFSDHRVTQLASAIERDDASEVRRLVAAAPIDFAARNRAGQTILGLAVEHALARDADAGVALESVRLLLAAGAPPSPHAIRETLYRGDPDSHLLVAHVFAANGPNALPLLDALLDAGADPDTRNHDGQPLYLSPYGTRPKLEVLARHGADFSALETTRPDRQGWTAAMVAAEVGNQDLVRFFLAHGVRADHVAPDGNSLRRIAARTTPA